MLSLDGKPGRDWMPTFSLLSQGAGQQQRMMGPFDLLWGNPRVMPREPLMIPGPRGDVGLTGGVGAQGPQGPAILSFLWGIPKIVFDPLLIYPPQPQRGGGIFCGASIASQVIAAATTALLADSLCRVGNGRLRLRQTFRWTIKVSKSAAGLNTSSIFLVKIGTLGTAVDPTILTFTLPATQTAVVDDAEIVIVVTVRGPLGAACVVQGYFSLVHNLAATGFATIPCVVLKATSAGFNSAVDSLIASITCTTAAATVLTFEQVLAETIEPAA